MYFILNNLEYLPFIIAMFTVMAVTELKQQNGKEQFVDNNNLQTFGENIKQRLSIAKKGLKEK